MITLMRDFHNNLFYILKHIQNEDELAKVQAKQDFIQQFCFSCYYCI